LLEGAILNFQTLTFNAVFIKLKFPTMQHRAYSFSQAIQGVTIVAACGTPGGGRHLVSSRLLKHFCILALPTPSTKSLQHIYQVQLGRFLHDGEFSPDVKQCLLPVVTASIAIYYRMQASMKPTPMKIHYTFNIRDLAKVRLLIKLQLLLYTSRVHFQIFS
jgi:hypothetical protein